LHQRRGIDLEPNVFGPNFLPQASDGCGRFLEQRTAPSEIRIDGGCSPALGDGHHKGKQ